MLNSCLYSKDILPSISSFLDDASWKSTTESCKIFHAILIEESNSRKDKIGILFPFLSTIFTKPAHFYSLPKVTSSEVDHQSFCSAIQATMKEKKCSIAQLKKSTQDEVIIFIFLQVKDHITPNDIYSLQPRDLRFESWMFRRKIENETSENPLFSVEYSKILRWQQPSSQINRQQLLVRQLCTAPEIVYSSSTLRFEALFADYLRRVTQGKNCGILSTMGRGNQSRAWEGRRTVSKGNIEISSISLFKTSTKKENFNPFRYIISRMQF